jgi:anti-sigma B factor antagonist
MVRLGLSHPTAGVALVEVRGELDVRTAPDLRDMVERIIAGGDRRVVIDLNQVDYLDSTGLGALVRSARCVHAANGELQIVCEAPRIQRIMEIAGLSRILALCVSRAEAFERLGVPVVAGVAAPGAE